MTKKAVFRVRSLMEQSRSGSYGGSRREDKTRNRSHAGTLFLQEASAKAAPLMTDRSSGASEKEGPPSWRSVEEMAALCVLMEEADKLLMADKEAR